MSESEAEVQRKTEAADARLAEVQAACDAAVKGRDEALLARQKAEGEVQAAQQVW